MRRTRTVRDVIAGCMQCRGTEAMWNAPNAQAVAAKHHDKTGHETWVDVNLMIRYGDSGVGGEKK